jgi:hypothetical protein
MTKNRTGLDLIRELTSELALLVPSKGQCACAMCERRRALVVEAVAYLNVAEGRVPHVEPEHEAAKVPA